MSNTPFDWSTFTLKIGITADSKAIFDSWTSQEQLEKWFLSKAEFTDSAGKLKSRDENIAIGDTYYWEWHSSDYQAQGEVISTDPFNSLKFTFLGCEVIVSIYQEAGESVVEIVQSKIANDEESIVAYHLGCTRGWTFYLANLKSVLEGGLDLRNKNYGLKGMINT